MTISDLVDEAKGSKSVDLSDVFIGIDPGVSGAMAAFKNGANGLHVIDLADMPVETLRSGKRRVEPCALNKWLDDVVDASVPCRVWCTVEAVHSMPRDGASAAFSFGDAVGCIRGVLANKSFSHTYVTPQKWKKDSGLIGADKDYSRTIARQMFGIEGLERKKDHNRADALLIGVYGMKHHAV